MKISILHLNNDRLDRETYGATRRYLEEHLIPSRIPDSDTPTIIVTSPPLSRNASTR